MSHRLSIVAFFTLAVAGFWACEPDLDGLSAGYSAGRDGSGGDTARGGTEGSAATGAGGAGGSEAGGGNQAGEAGAGPAGSSLCDNLAQDENESDVDCGGSSLCPRCSNKLRCGNNKDCASGFCKGGRCAEPTCGDGYQNQDETGTDCGGSCAPALGCDLGAGCLVNQDCTSQFCKNGECVDHCGSGKRDADETDTDCGGSECGPCADTDKCQRASDCTSKICFNNVCQAPTCSDHIQNQDESDKDCGGSCDPCAVTKLCDGPADCETFVCTNDECAPDIDVPAGDVIDDFEDGDTLVKDEGGRVGNWYGYGDGSGTFTWQIATVPGRGPDGTYALHTTGSDFMVWGSGAGVDLNNAGGAQNTKSPYDGSAYTGITFWARAESALLLTVALPDADTDAAGGTCVTCDHHWVANLQVDEIWRRYTVPFSDLTLEPGGDPIPSSFDAGGIVSVQFRFAAGTTYDLWIDGVAFVE